MVCTVGGAAMIAVLSARKHELAERIDDRAAMTSYRKIKERIEDFRRLAIGSVAIRRSLSLVGGHNDAPRATFGASSK